VALSSLDRPPVVGGLRLIQLVGRGGEGEVWAARDGRGRARALKLVRPECLAEPDEALRRGVWLTRIDHPSLVRVHRTGVLTDLPPRHFLAGWGFVEMDFVDGQSLEGAAPDPAVFQRLESLAEALDLLHAGLWSHGVPLVHRDVKPANIVEDSAGRFVLVDPSTLRGADATHVTRIGTPVFAPPEVATGRSGPAADVYSFAATLVALGTGLRGAALADQLRDVDRLSLPPGVRAALSADPGHRPASCRSVLQRSETIVLRERAPGPVAAPDQDDAGWLHEPSGATPAPGRRRAVLPWLTVVVAVCAAPAVAAVLGGLGGQTPLMVAGVAVAVHLGAQLAGRGPLGLAVVLPPLAWALLLARRLEGARRRRAWASAILLVGLTGMASAPVLAFLDGPAGFRAALVGGLGVAAALLGVAGARAVGPAGAVLRLATLPLWVLGAGAVVALSLAVLPFALLAGRGGPLLRATGTTLASVVEIARPPVSASWNQP